VKGAGYALEAIVAIATIFVFVFGSLTVPPNQDWADFRETTSAQDLTYAMQQTGYINHALKNGETGSLQTAFSTVTERNIEVSGLVSNLPINENRVAFYVNESSRYTRQLKSVSGSECEGDLEEITGRSEDGRVLKTVESAPINPDGNVTYLGDLDPSNTSSGGDGKVNYDSIWIDNGTQCQFSSAEGPYNIEEIFKWHGEYYDFKWVKEDEEMKIYHATQPVRFRNMFNQKINDVETFTTIDTVNFTRLDSREYNTVVFRRKEPLNKIDSSDTKRRITEEFLQTGSILFLADLNSDYFETDDFLKDAGFKHLNVDYTGTGNDVSFSNGRASQEVQTYFKGLKGDKSSLDIDPSGKVISNSEPTIKSGRAILKSDDKNYDFSEWNVKTNSMTSNQSPVQGAPKSDCYSESSNSLTNDTLSFPDSTYSIINAELGTSDNYCNNNDDRAIKIDFNDDGEYTDTNEGPFLNGESVVVDNREYGLKIPPHDSDSTVGCNSVGGCAEFLMTGDRRVELIPRRTSFPGLDGQKIALTGYQNSYGEDDLKMLVATVNWLRGDQVRFTGNQDPEGISTNTFSAIQNETYMPYDINLRWSR